MDDRLRETLSAMMDDEADELSVRRLLSHANQEQVRDQWQRWQQVRDLMHENHGPADGIDVASAVRQELDGRAPGKARVGGSVRPVRSRWHLPAAAMVFMALIVGFGAGAGWDSRSGAPGNVLAGNAAGVNGEATLPVPVEEVALQRLDEEQMQQMRQYLLEHAQHNSVGAGRGSVGYARLVSASY